MPQLDILSNPVTITLPMLKINEGRHAKLAKTTFINASESHDAWPLLLIVNICRR